MLRLSSRQTVKIAHFVNTASGTIGAVDITNLDVACVVQSYSLGGVVSGLLDNTQVTVQNGNDSLTVGNGNYVFPTQVAYQGTYAVSLSIPAGQSCGFSPSDGNAGSMPDAAVTSVNVTCEAQTYMLGGTVSGLLGSTNVTLLNGSDSIDVPNGAYTFPTSLAFNSNYAATLVSPDGQNCAFVNTASGTIGAVDITNLDVACVVQSYSLGGVVSGLLDNTQVTVQNGNDSLTVGNGNYVFPTQVAYQGTYAVSLSIPAGQSCGFSPSDGNAGSMPDAAVTSVNVTCGAQTYMLGRHRFWVAGQHQRHPPQRIR